MTQELTDVFLDMGAKYCNYELYLGHDPKSIDVNGSFLPEFFGLNPYHISRE